MRDAGSRDATGEPSLQAPRGAPPSLLRRLVPKLTISIGLGVLFAWLFTRGGFPLVPSAEQLGAVAPWAVPAYLFSLVFVHVLRASRWRFLIAPVQRIPLREVLLLNWIGFFAIFALPLRLGEVARPALTKMRHGVPISAGLGTVAVERVVDGLITSGCVAWALFALPRLATDDEVARLLPSYGYLALFLFSGAFIALAVFLWQRKLASRLTHLVLGMVSNSLARVVAEKISSVADGLRSIGDVRLGLAFLVESLLYWGINALGVWALGVGCGLPMQFGHAVAVMGVLAIGILLPTGPGLFGNFQLAVSAALHLYFGEALIEEGGAAFVFWLYVLQSSVMIAAGVIPLYALRLRMADLIRLPASS